MVRIGILGALQIERDGRAVEVAGGRLRALLARLALAAGRPVTVGALVDAVWDDELPADQQHALQSLISRLRRTLGDAIAAAPGGYQLAGAEVDADAFEQQAAAGAAALRAGDPERAAETLRAALELWRGPALADLTSRPLVAAAVQLEDLKLTALADRAEAELALGRGADFVSELEAALAEHPLHERLAARHIAALYAAGRQADALAAYERVRARLAEELGAAPSPELQAAHLAVLKGDTPRAASKRSNLRAPVTSFVGRAEQMAQMDTLLEQSRLVTLVGPGGAGKTRLAGEALARWVDRVNDGVWMVELAPVTAAVEIVPSVLAALGLRDAAVLDRARQLPRDGLDRLLDALADRETILLLDNCEHLIGDVAELTDRLLAACPDLRIVATSREPLAIAGENLTPVPPLTVDAAAVELFVDRATAAAPSFVLDESTTPAVLEICRRLDGLPLAIELAAARLRSMDVEQLAARLDDRFRVLTGGSRAVLPRHRTLRAVVDWSWGLLEEPERELARRLAVFSAGATEESAAAVAGDPDGLFTLVERSLLQVVAGPRYRMLETIREYALEKLDEAGELERTRTAHARYFLELAERAEPALRGHGQREWYARLQAEYDDVIAALRWLGDSGDRRGALRLAVSLLWYWILTGAQEEARTWVEFALDVEGEADPIDTLIAEGLRTLSRIGEGEDHLDAVTAILERLEREGDGRTLLALARPVLSVFAGDMETAQIRLAETLEHPDAWVRSAALMMRAHLAENLGDQEHMRADLERAADGFRELGDSWALALTLSSIAGALMIADDLDGAETVLDEATERLDAFNESSGTAVLWLRLAEIRVRRGDFAGAREVALRAVEDADLRREESLFVRATLARIAWLSGDVDDFRALVADAAERLERLNLQRADQGHAVAFVGGLQGIVAMEDGDFEAAVTLLDQALERAVATTDMPIVASVGVAAALVALRAGRAEDAALKLGASVVLRGAEDRSNPEIQRLLAELEEFEAAYARGRALDREAAIAALASRTPPVRA